MHTRLEVVPCRSKRCGELIRWRRTAANDKLMPIDLEPNPDGNIVIDGDGKAVVLGPLERELAVADGTELYMSHFATCSDPPGPKK